MALNLRGNRIAIESNGAEPLSAAQLEPALAKKMFHTSSPAAAARSETSWKAGLSMSATQYAADTPLVVTGMIATAGVFALWRFWVYSLAFLLMGFLL